MTEFSHFSFLTCSGIVLLNEFGENFSFYMHFFMLYGFCVEFFFFYFVYIFEKTRTEKINNHFE